MRSQTLADKALTEEVIIATGCCMMPLCIAKQVIIVCIEPASCFGRCCRCRRRCEGQPSCPSRQLSRLLLLWLLGRHLRQKR